MLPLKLFAVIRKVRVTHPHYLCVRLNLKHKAKLAAGVLIISLLIVLFWPRNIEGTYHFVDCLCDRPNYLLFHEGLIYVGHGFDSKLELIGEYRNAFPRASCTSTIRNTKSLTFMAYSSIFGLMGYDVGFRRRYFNYSDAVTCLNSKGFVDCR